MKRDWTRRRAPLALAVAVVVSVVAVVSATTTREGVALSIAIDLAIACVTTLSLPDLKSSHPVVSRAALTLLGLDVAIFITFFLNSSTNFNLATGAAMSIVLLGLSFLTGASGQISLGNGAFMGVGAFAMAIWSNHHATTPIFLTLLIAVGCGALVGLLLGLPATRLRGPYLAGMTLAFAVAFTFILSSFSSWTGGDSGLQLPTEASAPRWLDGFFHAGTSPLTTPRSTSPTLPSSSPASPSSSWPISSRVEPVERCASFRDNDVAAELVGISLPRARVVAFIVSSAYAALGGALLTLINNSVSPATYSFALSVTILSLIVIGGIGTISGAVIGGIIYAFSTNVISWITTQTGLNPQGNFASQLNGIIFGGLLILTMLFAPLGISGAVRHLWSRVRARTQG